MGATHFGGGLFQLTINGKLYEFRAPLLPRSPSSKVTGLFLVTSYSEGGNERDVGTIRESPRGQWSNESDDKNEEIARIVAYLNTSA